MNLFNYKRLSRSNIFGIVAGLILIIGGLFHTQPMLLMNYIFPIIGIGFIIKDVMKNELTGGWIKMILDVICLLLIFLLIIDSLFINYLHDKNYWYLIIPIVLGGSLLQTIIRFDSELKTIHLKTNELCDSIHHRSHLWKYLIEDEEIDYSNWSKTSEKFRSKQFVLYYRDEEILISLDFLPGYSYSSKLGAQYTDQIVFKLLSDIYSKHDNWKEILETLRTEK